MMFDMMPLISFHINSKKVIGRKIPTTLPLLGRFDKVPFFLSPSRTILGYHYPVFRSQFTYAELPSILSLIRSRSFTVRNFLALISNHLLCYFHSSLSAFCIFNQSTSLSNTLLSFLNTSSHMLLISAQEVIMC